MIKPFTRLYKASGQPMLLYKTDDGEEFESLEEAIDYENYLRAQDSTPKEKVVYDYPSSIQQAINMAVAEQRVVRFFTEKSNKEIKAGIEEKKDCQIMKSSAESTEVAIIPPNVTDFVF